VNERVSSILSKFRECFGSTDEAVLVQAPGRVNLIGEHTDYNGGFVLPIAIDRDLAIACRANGSDSVNLFSMDFEEKASFALSDIQFDEEKTWTNYVRGVAVCLKDAGHQTPGLDGVVQGNVPIGSGLSSSAAFEVAAAMAFLTLSGEQMDQKDLALLGQRAENTFVGVNCGIMDQYVSVFAEEGNAVLLDCDALTHELIPLATGEAKVVVCDTMVRRELAGSEYNVRRRECEEAVQMLKPFAPAAQNLRAISPEVFAAHVSELPDPIRKRARHVITEDERTVASTEALKAGDLAKFGQLMNESHRSLRDDYEVSCKELDTMVELASQLDGVYGARMTGGGFGGCTVNLVRESEVDAFCQQMAERYEKAIGPAPQIWVCDAAQGARVTTDVGTSCCKRSDLVPCCYRSGDKLL